LSPAPSSLIARQTLLVPREDYARKLEAMLPREVFRPVPRRLLWLPVHMAIMTACVVSIARFENVFVRLFAGIVIGNSLGTLGFLGHEIMHGSVIRNRLLIRIFGGACMAHWGIAPWLWITRHNRMHHQHTNDPFDDPDTFGSEALYRKSRAMRFLETFTPGSGTVQSIVFLFMWFTFHFGFVAFFYPIFKKRRDAITARIYFVLVHVVWALLASRIDGGLIWLMLVPSAISNFVMMAYVATNHGLSPLTPLCNDPLVNTLTVRTPVFVEIMHLQNNFHIEHHLLPYVNPSHAPRIAPLAKSLWPELYQEMSHARALAQIYRTPRLYRSETVLVNPRTKRTARTLLADAFETMQKSFAAKDGP